MAKKHGGKKHSHSLDALIFIDTNIYLDFYRFPDKSFEIAMLKHIEKNRDKIISTDQVLMEYKKNRQPIILKSLDSIKAPEWGILKIPAFIADTQQSKMIQNKKDELNKLIKKLQKRVADVLKNPTTKDPIYQCLQKLLKEGVPYHLGRKNKIRYRLRHLARKRFYLGYPPRKNDDSSIGDAINWEWIIQCAIDSNKDIIIVSRDSDYGFPFENERILNDWLQYEFKKRVSQKRKIILTDKLSTAFKLTGVTITKHEEKQEDKIILLASEEESNVDISPSFIKVPGNERFLNTLEEALKAFEKIKKRK